MDDDGKDGGIGVEAVDPRSPDAQAAMRAYFDELDERFPDGFDPGDSLTADAPHFDPPRGVFVVARSSRVAVGCGGLQRLGDDVGEIKRMWVAPAVRGQGFAGRLLADLEARASAIGYSVIRLDTNASLVEAIAMYERRGYVAIDRYNDNPYAQHWFEKRLA